MYKNTFLDQGGEISFNTIAHSIQKHPSNGFLVEIQKDIWVHSECVINSIGLHSNALTLSNDLNIPCTPLYYCKGHYVGYSGQSLVSRLIYPIPEKNVKSLGIHCTIDLSGKLKFGPDVVYTNSLDYGLESEKESALIDKFYFAVSRYLKGLDKKRMYYDYCGIRPKLSGPNDPFKDFMILNESGYIHLMGIESPGLTASLGIAEYVDNLLQ